jgi:hypothetical protein
MPHPFVVILSDPERREGESKDLLFRNREWVRDHRFMLGRTR